MIDDSPDWSDGETVAADLCIVGAGPVGLAIAHVFLSTPVKVLVLEAGGWRPTMRGQDYLWAEGEGAQNHSFAFSRFRAYGGSGGRWAGLCPALEPIDFRPLGTRPGWPLSREELEPWLRRAAALLDIPEPGQSADGWERRLGQAPRLGPELRPVVLPFARKRDLGAAHLEDFRRAANVRIVLGADVLAIQADAAGRRAEAVRVALRGGRRVRCRAREVVLAAGGVENARLMLLSNDRAPAGLGNAHDQVGRCFMDHLYCFAGRFEPTPRGARGPHVVERFHDLAAGRGAIVAFALDEETRQREDLNGAAAFFMRRDAFQLHPEYDGPGGGSLSYFAEVVRGERFLDRSAPARAGDLLRHAPAAVRIVLRHAAGLVRPRPGLALRMQVETTPRQDSRVTLAGTRDALGRPRARIVWRIDDDDLRGAQRLWSALARALSARGQGRLDGDALRSGGRWPASTTGGKHHMGTTRMSDDLRRGVVDPDCRVHGLDNLHVAGSSVFPTGGWANPTLTAVALALRLAGRLKARAGR